MIKNFIGKFKDKDEPSKKEDPPKKDATQSKQIQ